MGITTSADEVERIRQYFIKDGTELALAPRFRAVEVPDEPFDPTGPKRYMIGYSRYFPSSRKKTREEMQLFLTYDPKQVGRPENIHIEYNAGYRKWFMWGAVVATSRAEAEDMAIQRLFDLYDYAKQHGSKDAAWASDDGFVVLDSVFKQEDT